MVSSMTKNANKAALQNLLFSFKMKKNIIYSFANMLTISILVIISCLSSYPAVTCITDMLLIAYQVCL